MSGCVVLCTLCRVCAARFGVVCVVRVVAARRDVFSLTRECSSTAAEIVP
jgi:hypothetical protein